MQNLPTPKRTATKAFSLETHLPYLFRRAHFEADAIFPKIYRTGISSRQLALLVAVSERPGASQSDVAKAIGLDLNTCSDLVARTVGTGLLQRERSPIDARTYCLCLTDEGSAVLNTGLAQASEYQEQVSSRLNPGEREQLRSLLRKLLGFG